MVKDGYFSCNLSSIGRYDIFTWNNDLNTFWCEARAEWGWGDITKGREGIILKQKKERGGNIH